MRWLHSIFFSPDAPAGATPPATPAAPLPAAPPAASPPAAPAAGAATQPPPVAPPPAATPPAPAIPAEFSERLMRSDNARFRAEQDLRATKAELESKSKALDELERTIQADPEAALAKYNKTIEDILDRRVGGGKPGASEEVRAVIEENRKLNERIQALEQGRQADAEAHYLGTYAAQVAPALEADPMTKAGLVVAAGWAGTTRDGLLADLSRSHIAAYHKETEGGLLTPSQAADRMGIGMRAKRSAMMALPGFREALCTYFDLRMPDAAAPAAPAAPPGAPPAAAPAPTLQPGTTPPGAGAPVDLTGLSPEERLAEIKRRHGIK